MTLYTNVTFSIILLESPKVKVKVILIYGYYSAIPLEPYSHTSVPLTATSDVLVFPYSQVVRWVVMTRLSTL